MTRYPYAAARSSEFHHVMTARAGFEIESESFRGTRKTAMEPISSFLRPTMSYSFHPQFSDEYSTPSTPRELYSTAPNWDILNEQQPQAQGAQMPTQDLGQPSPLTPLQSTPTYAQHLQLESEPYASGHVSPIDDSVRLHPVHPSFYHHERSDPAT